MADRLQQGREFWFDFDNQALWRRTQEITDAIQAAYGPLGGSLDAVTELFAMSFRQSNHPTPFITAIQAGKQGFLDLAEIQRKIMTTHFGNDAGALRDAFIDFGQGVLFDNRPPRSRRHFVHMMDGTPADFVGYHRWHAERATPLSNCSRADAPPMPHRAARFTADSACQPLIDNRRYGFIRLAERPRNATSAQLPDRNLAANLTVYLRSVLEPRRSIRAEVQLVRTDGHRDIVVYPESILTDRLEVSRLLQ